MATRKDNLPYSDYYITLYYPQSVKKECANCRWTGIKTIRANVCPNCHGKYLRRAKWDATNYRGDPLKMWDTRRDMFLAD